MVCSDVEFDFDHLPEACGLLADPGAIGSVVFLRRVSYLGKDDEAKLEEVRLAETMLGLLWSLVGNELLSLMLCAHRPPGRFAGFLHAEPGVPSATMAWWRRLWARLAAAEEAAKDDFWLSSFLQGLGWAPET